MKTCSAAPACWSQPLEDLLQQLDTRPMGLSTDQARRRLETVGLNTLKRKQQHSAFRLFLRQFRDPLVLILIFAVCVSVLVGEWVDAAVVFVVIIGTAVLSFVQEYNATAAVEKLLARVEIKATVLRDGKAASIPTEVVVPGDVVLLSAGSLIPGDGVILQAKACYVDQAALTGETFPVDKMPGIVKENASLAERTNCVYMGTSVRSGTAEALIVETGTNTAFGRIAERLTLRTIFEFVPLPFSVMLLLVLITGFYVLAAELAKKVFYTRVVKPLPGPSLPG